MGADRPTGAESASRSDGANLAPRFIKWKVCASRWHALRDGSAVAHPRTWALRSSRPHHAATYRLPSGNGAGGTFTRTGSTLPVIALVSAAASVPQTSAESCRL